MIETQIQVQLDHFDGPLGLLLHLIQREEMSIADLDINLITHQYLRYLEDLKDLNFDIAGEYLYMAATLLYIKSKKATEEDTSSDVSEIQQELQITTRAELISKLEELEKFQKLGKAMLSLNKRDEDIFVRPKVNRKALEDNMIAPVSLQALVDVMVDFLKREKRKYTVVKRDRLSIKEKLKQLKEALSQGMKTTLKELIMKAEDRDEVVITFISLLELARLQKLEVFQNQGSGEIYVTVTKGLDSFDIETANGFDPEEETPEVVH